MRLPVISLVDVTATTTTHYVGRPIADSPAVGGAVLGSTTLGFTAPAAPGGVTAVVVGFTPNFAMA